MPIWNQNGVYDGLRPNVIFPVTSGLILQLDAGDTASYPGTGTTWTDLSGNGYNFTVQSGSWVSAGAASYFNFSGSFCCAKRVVGGALTNVPSSTTNTLMVFSSILNSTSTWRTLVRAQSGVTNADHQIITNTGSNNIGYYNNGGGTPTGYIDSTYAVTSITNYTTVFNCLHFKFGQSSPYWTMGWNNNFGVATITSAGAINDAGIASIGGYHNDSAAVTSSANASQYWGNIALVLYYNRTLTNAEITQNFNFYKGRYGLT
jgi:hypothetical protein